jgi:hypothetical protein
LVAPVGPIYNHITPTNSNFDLSVVFSLATVICTKYLSA